MPAQVLLASGANRGGLEMNKEIRAEMDRNEAVAAKIAPYVPLVIVMAFVVNPMLAFFDPYYLLIACSFVFVAIVNLIVAHAKPWKERSLSSTTSLVLAGAGFITLVGMMFAAQPAVALKDTHCAALQVDMGLFEPKRKDSAALFQALNCRPAKIGTIQFEPVPASTRAALPGTSR
jgi:hypothetical protein